MNQAAGTRAVAIHASRLATAHARCEACGRHDWPRSAGPNSRGADTWIVVANVYVEDEWDRREVWCLRCYEGAGAPHGIPMRKDNHGRLLPYREPAKA